MQEVDAGRLTSYGVDNALWLARRLGMRAVFAPALEGLSGVALLTRLPVEETARWPLPSELEATAMAHARVAIPGGTLYAYGLWLGLEEAERLRQIEAALAIIGENEPALLGGDMNTEPGSVVYRAIEAAGFVDPFVVTGALPGYSSPAIDPQKRIDYVWARGLEPVEGAVAPSLASDHRLVVVEVALP
jgi:endonuclease/exonuclease/phosphatase family metal-dependent hydrolase